MELRSQITFVKGVGPSVAAKLQAIGVVTVKDLLYYLPRRYEDFSHTTPIKDLVSGKVTIVARVESVTGRYVRRGLHITEAVLADKDAKVRAVWFNQPYRSRQLVEGESFYFSGEYMFQRNRYIINNPATEKETDFAISTGRILPIYSEVKGLKSLQLRRILRELVPLMQALPESLPPALVRRENLLPLSDTLRELHFPTTSERLEKAKERFAFEELFDIVLNNSFARQQMHLLSGYPIAFDKTVALQFSEALSFKLTNAQRRAAWEVFQDFERGLPMHRLLQGDVGSGKTAVAAMASFMAIRAGYQVAFMAPTEILATQHAQTLATLLEPLNVRLALLTGSLTKKVRQTLLDHTASGEIDLVIGTHALIQKDSHFKNLGFVIVDEQHRFGVEQRSEMLKKSERIPHLLTMTATPIPRSLQLTLFGELDVSVIDELPKGRLPIITELFTPHQRTEVYERIDEQIAQGKQAYVVCPLVGEGVQAEVKSVEAEYELLQSSLFKHRRLGMLHGQLKQDEKEAVMQRFKRGELDMLIATSIVEVGVDVPNATVMLIEGTERFGLAQLHQLRGRVGRGSGQSYCFLIPSSGHKPSERLRELEQSQDGFHLAEVDLRLRGPGELYGSQQHGQLSLQVASLTDLKLIKRVQRAASWLIETYPSEAAVYVQLSRVSHRYRWLVALN
jgi:ATP-dependent DNA helicase RecG